MVDIVSKLTMEISNLFQNSDKAVQENKEKPPKYTITPTQLKEILSKLERGTTSPDYMDRVVQKTSLRSLTWQRCIIKNTVVPIFQ